MSLSDRMADIVRRAATQRSAALPDAPALPSGPAPSVTPLPADTLRIPPAEPLKPQSAKKGRKRIDPPHDAWLLLQELHQVGVTVEVDTGDPTRITVHPGSALMDAQRQQLERLSYHVRRLLGDAPAPPSEHRAQRSAWPAALSGLGPKSIGPYTPCPGCGTGTFVRYDGVPLDLVCAQALADLGRPWGARPASEAIHPSAVHPDVGETADTEEETDMSSYKRWVRAGGAGGEVFKWDDGALVEGVWQGQKDGKFGPLGMVQTEAGETITFAIPTALALDLEHLKVRMGETVRIKCLGLKRNEKTGREFKAFETDVLRDGDAPIDSDEEPGF